MVLFKKPRLKITQNVLNNLVSFSVHLIYMTILLSLQSLGFSNCLVKCTNSVAKIYLWQFLICASRSSFVPYSIFFIRSISLLATAVQGGIAGFVSNKTRFGVICVLFCGARWLTTVVVARDCVQGPTWMSKG